MTPQPQAIDADRWYDMGAEARLEWLRRNIDCNHDEEKQFLGQIKTSIEKYLGR